MKNSYQTYKEFFKTAKGQDLLMSGLLTYDDIDRLNQLDRKREKIHVFERILEYRHRSMPYSTDEHHQWKQFHLAMNLEQEDTPRWAQDFFTTI